jgi:cell wall-associated NlpC family hydrolase
VRGTSALRGLLRGLLVLVTAAGAGLLAPAAAHADPSVAEVERQLDKAWEKLEPVIEQYNKVHSQLKVSQQKSAEVTQRLRPLQAQVDEAMSRVSDIAVRQYMRGRMSGLESLLATGSPQTFADRLAVLDYVARTQAQEVAGVAVLRDRYAANLKGLDVLGAQQEKQDAELAARKKVIQAEVDRLQKLRIELGAPPPSKSSLYIGTCPAVYAGGAAGVAVKRACAQIGKPYVWGADGPGSFDCSGLTQYAWKAAGVSLTHFTGAQWREGTPVSRSELRPGDLVFFYSDLHHVGMYVGNGLIVHASRSGVPVKMARMEGKPYMGARRPG